MKLLLILLLSFPALALAKQAHMTALPAEDRALFGAVGRVNISGFKARGACSGTLIAPDVVLTAAHCIAPGFASGRVFVAGWDRGEFIAARKAAREIRHPGYAKEGQASPANDIGLVFLDTPITDVAPMPTGTATGYELGIVGYHQFVPHLLSGRLDCARVDLIPGQMQLGCPVTAGNSGGPVLEWQDGRWVVVGVISAKRPGGTAIAVPLGTWVREQMDRR